MNSGYFKSLAFSLTFFLSLSIISCQKDDSAIKEQIAQLTARISTIETQITQINLSLGALKEAGKLNTDETAVLKTLVASLSNVVTDLKSSAGTSSKDINDLKIALQLSGSVFQVSDLKTTITQLSELISKNYTDLDNENKNTAQLMSGLQTLTAQLARDLDSLKTVESTQDLVGKIEKGGFAKGSLINFFEMDSTLTQTGRSFNTTITDNFGSFDLKVKNLKGKICRVVTDGFFFNEVSGKNTNSRVTLTGLVKIDSSETLNLNVLTHLERPRVEYLIKNGITFKNAKAQAVSEVLKAFGIANPGITRSEKINLIGSAKRNNILLAVSTLLVGFRSESELTELLTDLSEDLKTDGDIDDISIGNDIESHIYYMDTTAVIDHVKDKYSTLYADSVIEKLNLSYIKTFETNTNYTKSNKLIEYPLVAKSVFNHSNILAGITPGNLFNVNAVLKSAGMTLRIEIIAEDSESLLNYNLSAFSSSNQNWFITSPSRTRTILTTSTPGLSTVTLSLSIEPKPTTKVTVLYYENNTATPTKTMVYTYE